MKNTIIAILALGLISPVTSFANNVGEDCSAYIKSIRLDDGNYKFRIVDEFGENVSNSNDWSFKAKDKDIAQVLNLAYLLRHKVCINYTYSKTYWEITNVQFMT